MTLCPTCVHAPFPDAHRCGAEDLGLSPGWYPRGGLYRPTVRVLAEGETLRCPRYAEFTDCLQYQIGIARPNTEADPDD